MNRSIIAILLLVIFTSCENKSGGKTANTNNKYDYYVKVTGISDGDTFTGLKDDNTKIRCRIYGIDAPERTQAFSNRSKEYLSDLIYEKKIGIIVQKKQDGFGRPVVWAFTPDGKDVSSEMLKAGMAWHFKSYDNSKEYEELEKAAKKNRIGLWKDDDPTPPWDFRREKRN